jgi:hypothetical protein
VTAIGGALVIGAWIRIVRAKRWRYAWLFGVGAVIVVLARPFEGSVLLVPALITLGVADRSARVWLPIALIGVAGASWFAYDNYRITGHPLRLAYREYCAALFVHADCHCSANPSAFRPGIEGARYLRTRPELASLCGSPHRLARSAAALLW